MMQAQLAKNGVLYLSRKFTWKETFCPFREDSHCGDFCPLLTEEEMSANIPDKIVRLNCCGIFYPVVDDLRDYGHETVKSKTIPPKE